MSARLLAAIGATGRKAVSGYNFSNCHRRWRNRRVLPDHGSTLRFDVGTTLVRYLTSRPDPNVYAFGSLLSPQYIVTQGNFQMSTSYQWRF